MDAVAQQQVFHDEFVDLLGCGQLTIFPPFPDYSLLSQSRVPRILLKAVNEVVLSRRSSFAREHGWLLIPLIHSERLIGVLFAEEVGEMWADKRVMPLLERLSHLCLDRIQWQKRVSRDTETMLWSRQALMQELNRAIEMAENGSRLTTRRLLGDNPCPAQFTLICFLAAPAPESWAGAGPFWTRLGPLVEKSLPAGAKAAHLGGGYLGVVWPKEDPRNVRAWTERLLRCLKDEAKQLPTNEVNWELGVGIATFPEDFYDDGPLLPWEKSSAEGIVTAAREVIRRVSLAAEAARAHEGEEILTYHQLRERGLAPERESAIRRLLSAFCANDEPGALLLVKLDDWREWQHRQGSKAAARQAKLVLKASRELCPENALVGWAGPDHFGVLLPESAATPAQAQAENIRLAVKSKLNTTVSIGLSAHPCQGFEKADLLENARKALVHAGFFGRDSQTLFDAVSLNISGDRLYEAGRLEEALQEFRLGLALDHSNVNIRNSMGACYAQMGKLDKAVEEFSQAAVYDPNDFMPHYNLGCALLKLGREGEAESALNRAGELDPDNAGVWFQLGKLCRQQDRLEEAVVHLERAVTLKGDWAQAWRLVAESHLEGDAPEEALRAFKKALRVNSDDAAALSGLAVAYGRLEANLEIALSLARRSVELEPDNVLFMKRLAELLLENQELDEAKAQCEQAASIAPDDGQIRRLQERIEAAQRTSAT